MLHATISGVQKEGSKLDVLENGSTALNVKYDSCAVSDQT